MFQKSDVAETIDRYIRGTLSPKETEAFFRMFSQKDLDPELEEYLWQAYLQSADVQIWPEEFRILFADRVANKILSNDIPQETRIVHPIHLGKRVWFRYAAAVVLLIGLCTFGYLWTSNKKNDRPLTTTNKQSTRSVPPGGEKAVLTLADGTKIILDNAADGSVAEQGNAQVVKLANGQIVYHVKGLANKEIMWNTMTTPVGGQYQVTLPDGTRVWLNAASSITYPAAFVSNDRQVKITGEAYFEVAKDKSKPFIVNVDGKSTVRVLGTRFNINTYENELNTKTTLVEGSLKVISDTTTDISSPDVSQPEIYAILKPGQQAQIINKTALDASSNQQRKTSGADIKPKITVSSDVDIDQTLAWKNGLFSFNNTDLRSLMRQLERWYDVKVRYEGEIPDISLEGKMYRNVNLSAVLDFLQRMGVKSRMEGKTVVVL